MPQEASPSLLSPLFERSSLEPTILAARRLRRKNHIEKLPKSTRNPPRHHSRRTCLVCVWDANVRDANVGFRGTQLSGTQMSESGTQMSGTQKSATQMSGHRLDSSDSPLDIERLLTLGTNA
ncbi:hypothetical protein L596_025380 [Steinernema carpocapsae]|uniref:Uncharacterized protein n=1 Tax=Steinernema carpocapsae TaxID=34508 RepID=A0A4V5ZYS9_STECR|nr:hypothetical protein L596_025380 [Steinernema carpocapsae]